MLLNNKFQLNQFSHFTPINHGKIFQLSRGFIPAIQQQTVLKATYQNPANIARLKYEQYLLSKLNIDGIPKILGYISEDQLFGLLLEDLGPMTLHDYISKNGRLSLPQFFKMALKLTEIICKMHRARIIHKAIKPEAIIIRNDSPNLVDFSHATDITKENTEYSTCSFLEDFLPYMSPEQSGRMNHIIDYRTDFYSLGAVLYYALSGHTLYMAKDTLDWIHCHLALTPIPLSVLDKNIPQALNDIIMKLLNKNPENRYQSSNGLIHDLQKCQQHILDKKNNHFFKIGEKDFKNQLQLPRTIYGRKQEIDKLIKSFEYITKGNTALVLISGFSGIGKTAVVHEIQRNIAENRGLFLSGKFDQLRRNTPYAALTESFETLIQRLLSTSSTELASWRHKIIEALGSNAQYLLNILPGLARIIDIPPVIEPDIGNNYRNRFEMTLKAFIKIFTQKTHPLVLFLDDLQWVDSASLNFIKTLMNDQEQQYLMLIGAYRNNEVGEDHQLHHALQVFRQAPGSLVEIQMGVLTKTDINQIITDMLCPHINKLKEFQDCIYRQTAGNPFFIIKFIQIIYHEKALTWHEENQCWFWSLDSIEKIDINDDAVLLMKKLLYQLPHTALELIKQASCIGNRFSLRILAQISRLSIENIHTLLTQYCCHLLQSARETFGNNPAAQNTSNIEVQYTFLHNRIPQAAYQLISEQVRAEIHLQIARKAIHEVSPDIIQKNLFFIVDQFNNGLQLSHEQHILNIKEQKFLTELNFAAGEKAIQSSAFNVALHYFKNALSLMPPASWQNNYSFSLTLHTLAAEAAMYTASEVTMMNIIRQVRLHASSILDEIPVIELQIKYASQHNKLTQALDIACQTLHSLNVQWQSNIKAAELDSYYELIDTKIKTLGGPDEFMNLPQETNAKKLATIRILFTMIEATRGHNYLLFQQNILYIMELSCSAIHPCTGFIMGCYGLLLCGVRHEFTQGVKFGNIAEQIVQLYKGSQYYARMKFVVYANVRSFGPAFESNLTGLKESFEYGFETGDLNYAGHANLQYIVIQFFIGKNLNHIFAQLNKYVPRLTSLGLDFGRQFLMPLYQLIYNLTTDLKKPYEFKGPYFSESSFDIINNAENKMYHFSAYSAKAYLCFILNEYSDAYEALKIAEKFLPVMTGLIHHHQHIFIVGLCHIAMSRINAELKKMHLSKALQALTRLELLSLNAPENFYNKALLIKAELARVNHDFAKASMLYNQAIAASEETGLIHEQAMSHELAAEFFMEFGHKQAAAHSFIAARDLYVSWGARAKVAQLQKKHIFLDHDHLLDELNAQKLFKMKEQPYKYQQDIDNLTLMRLSQLISRQIDITKLPPLLMNIMATNAGADRGCLLLKQNNHFVIEAAFPEMMKGEYDYQAFSYWSSAAIHYVAHSKEYLLISETSKDTLCCNDPYIQQSQVKSLMCIPILDKGRLLGILYLENSQSSHVFTQQLVDFMQVIAAQVAISLENCHLFSELQSTKQALHEQAELYESILNSVGEGIIITDSKLNRMHFNPAAKRIHGIEYDYPVSHELLNQYSYYDLNTHQPVPVNNLPIIRALAGEQVDEQEILLKNNDTGKETVIAATACPIYTTDGTIQNAVVVIRDINERKEREVQMRHMATHDSLTQLPNRALFINRLHQSMDNIESSQNIGAVMFLDLDNFKEINDSLGHDIGDALLKAISSRLQHHIKATDTVARLGGDEFGILMNNIASLQNAAQITQRIINEVLKPIEVDGQMINTSVSVGITMFPADGQKPAQLLKNADIAMYCSKNAGRNTYSFFTHEMKKELNFRKNLSEKLLHAIKNDKLEIYYQPLFCVKKSSMTGVEALLRWPENSDSGTPAVFIPIAEQYGLISAIGEWVLERVCSDIHFIKTYIPDIKVAINISPFQLRKKNFVQRFKSIIMNSGVSSHHIELEITEGAALYDLKNTIQKLHELKDFGISLSLDDFGTGYSSLSYLKILPVSKVKIDQSFIRDLTTNKDSASIAQAIIDLSHCLNMQVVAEGVENSHQLQMLKEARCDIIQGYFLSYPLRSSELKELAEG